MDTRERIQAAIRENPNQMTMLLANQFGVPEVDIVRAFPDDRAAELDARRWEELIRRLESFGKVHVIVSNGAATLEANGEFGWFSATGDFFNVQTKSLDMHIRWREIGAFFVIEKPGHLDGNTTLSSPVAEVLRLQRHHHPLASGGVAVAEVVRLQPLPNKERHESTRRETRLPSPS